MKLIIARHGQTEENVNGIVQGWLPGKLTRAGMDQADALGRSLEAEKIEVIFSSDLARARHTTEAILKYNHAPVHYVQDLRERNHGVFSGKPNEVYHSAEEASGQGKMGYRAGGGGENFRDVYRRSSRFVESIYEEYPDKTVLVVTHGGVIRCLYSFYTKTPLEEAVKLKTINTGILVVDVGKSGAKVLKETVFMHAQGEESLT